MNDFYNNLDKDTSTVMQSYGSQILSTLKTKEAEFEINVIFENKTEEVTPSGFVAPIEDPIPLLYVQEIEIANTIARELTKADIFLILGTEYRVKTVMNDGLGLLTITLNKGRY